MRFYSFLRGLREEFDGQGNDLGGGSENNKENTIQEPAKGYEDVKDEKAQEIIKEALESQSEDGNNVNNNDGSSDEDNLFAGKYKTREDLIKGIENIGNELPEYILNGMNDEALEKHYKELSKQKRQPDNKDENKDRKHQEKKEEENKEQEENKSKIGKELWQEAEAYYNENNGLSEELYDKLEDAGIPSDIVDRYIDSLKIEQENFTNKIYDMAGGKEQFEIIKDWAENNIPQAELDAISNMPKDAMISALEGVKARYEFANSNQTKRIEGNSNTSNSGSVYKTNDEYFRDVSDKRYSSDERFRKSVEDKFSRSKL